jgi:membrane protein
LEKITRYGEAFVNLLQAAWIEYERDRARYFAVAMIYYALVSMVPLVLLLLSALGLVLRFSVIAADAQHQMLVHIEANFGTQLRLTIERLLNILKEESIIATVIGLAGLVVTGSLLFKHLRMTFRAIWNYEPPLVSGPPRVVIWTTILERVIAFAMVLSGGVLLLAALVLMSATQWLHSVLGRLPFHVETVGWLLTGVTSWAVAAITFALLFKFLPPVPIGWRDVWLAVLLCASAWVVVSEFLAFFGGFFGDVSGYGALGGVLVAMLWMNIVSKLLFFGAEVCKVVATQGGSGGIRQTPKRKSA